MASVKVEPESGLMDDRISICLRGLRPKQDVTLFGRLQEGRMLFISSACFVADEHGDVDVSKTASSAGTYTGVHPTGILWSMKPAPGQRSGIRLVKKDVCTPFSIRVAVHRGHITTEQCLLQDNAIATSQFERFYKSEGVQRTQVRHGRIRGTLFVPPGPGPHPGVIDIFGSAGGIMEHRAALLASRGFTTLALPYFAYDDLPAQIFNVDLEYFEEAVDWFSSLSAVSGHHIGISAVSFGADIVLQLIPYLPKVKACVCIGVLYYSNFAFMHYKGQVFKPNPNGL